MRNSAAGDRPMLVIIGDPQSRRMPLLLQAASHQGYEPRIVDYDSLLHERQPSEFVGPNVLVRIESPGESPKTMRQILRAGEEAMEDRRLVPVDSAVLEQYRFERGEIVHPKQWFLGFAAILERLRRTWTPRGVRWMNPPDAVIAAFDKQHCLDCWNETEVPTPPRYPGITTYSQIRQTVNRRHARVFIKLRYGYSAMGAVALEWRDNRVRAITTADVAWSAGRPRLFVTKRPRELHREFEIAWLIDTLGMEDIIVEDWLSKARWQGQPFDLRIVVIHGRAHHVVGRASHSPFTNLNLDGERIPADDVATLLGDSWPQTLALAERAAIQISTGYLGMDLLVRSNRRQSVVLEANAFGDYLPGLLHQGESTYAAQMRLFSDCGVCA